MVQNNCFNFPTNYASNSSILLHRSKSSFRCCYAFNITFFLVPMLGKWNDLPSYLLNHIPIIRDVNPCPCPCLGAWGSGPCPCPGLWGSGPCPCPGPWGSGPCPCLGPWGSLLTSLP